MNRSQYNPTVWIDYLTPVDADNLNKHEKATEQQATDINVLSEYVLELETRTSNDIQVLSDFVSALDDKISDLTYVPISVSSFINNQNIVEKGERITSIIFNWSYNKSIVSQKFNGLTIDPTVRTTTVNEIISGNRSYSIEGTDDRNNKATRASTVTFLNGIYYGVSSSTIYNNSLVLSLSKTISETKGRTITVDAGPGQYIYYCLPSRLGDCSFKVGGFDGGFSKVATISFTNSKGYSENYDIYRSTNQNLGSTQVIIS